MSRGRRDTIERLAELARTTPGLDAAARERALQAALDVTEYTPARTVPPLETGDVARLQRYLFPAVAGLAAAAAVVLLVVSPSSRHRSSSAPPPSQPVAGATVELQPLQEMKLGDATVRALGQRAAVLAVRESEESGGIMLSGIMLSGGRVELRATDGDHRYRIETPKFRVDTANADLEVDPAGVRVRRGAVSIYAGSGEVIELGAGQTWSITELDTGRAQPTGDEAAAEPTAPEPTDGEAPPAPSRTTSAATWIERGRRALAEGDVDRARTAVARALAARPGARLRAEAETLRADAAMVAGDREEALRQYIRVAERYRTTATGETALFAAARLAARSGATAKAVGLFETYLQRYPDGRFAEEAGEWIERLR